MDPLHRGFIRPAGTRRPAEHVWVLMGSIGALSAIRRLLRAVSDDQSLAFIVAIRSSAAGVPLIARLLSKTTPFHVYAAGMEKTLYPNDLLVITIDGSPLPEGGAPRGAVKALSIDDALRTLAEHYRERLGTIVLSGISIDGVQGCRAVVKYGGQVWTQDAESCAHSNLPWYIGETCEASYCGTPEALARRLMERVKMSKAPRLAEAQERQPSKSYI